MRAESVGKRTAEEFIEQRIKHNHIGFYETIKKNKLKTVTTILSTHKVSVNGKGVVIWADRALFARLLVIREKRGVSIKELLQYSLGSIAWSLAKPEGNIFKSVKSKLQNALEEKMNLVDSVSQNCARVFDRMSIVQQIPSGLEIFGCLSDFILTRITNNSSLNIFFTTDQYWDASIKSCERNR